MKALFKLEYILTKRNAISFIMSIGMPVLFFLVFSSMMVFQDKELERFVIRNYLVTLTAFSMSGFALFTLPMILKEEKQTKWFVQIKHLPVSLKKYYTVKMIRVLIGFILAIGVNFSVGIFVKHISFSPVELLTTAIFLLLTSMVYIAVGLLITCLNSMQLLTLTSNVAYFVLAIFGGSWIPVSQFPEWMKQIAKIMPSYYTNNLVLDYLNQKIVNIEAMAWIVGYISLCLGGAYVIQKRQESHLK